MRPPPEHFCDTISSVRYTSWDLMAIRCANWSKLHWRNMIVVEEIIEHWFVPDLLDLVGLC